MKNLRLRRIINPDTGKMLIYPLDHGMTLGPIEGIENIYHTMSRVSGLPVDGFVLHKGQIKHVAPNLGRNRLSGIIMHLNGSVGFSPNCLNKIQVSTVQDALRMGADAVSFHLNIGCEDDKEMLKALGDVSSECEFWGMPLLVMAYAVKGGKVTNDTKQVAIAARVAMELGADLVKLSYTGSPETFAQVVEGADIPIIVAGGGYDDNPRQFLQNVYDSMQVGAAGIAVGRKIFQDRAPERVLLALQRIINEGASVDFAYQEMLAFNLAEAKASAI